MEKKAQIDDIFYWIDSRVYHGSCLISSWAYMWIARKSDATVLENCETKSNPRSYFLTMSRCFFFHVNWKKILCGGRDRFYQQLKLKENDKVIHDIDIFETESLSTTSLFSSVSSENYIGNLNNIRTRSMYYTEPFTSSETSRLETKPKSVAHIINHFWKRWSIWSDYDSAKKLFNRVIIYPLYLSPASGWLKIGHKSEKWQWRHNLLTWRHCQFFKHCFVFLVKFSYWCKFHVNIITGSGQFSFIGDCPISGDWGELEIPNLARMYLMKCY